MTDTPLEGIRVLDRAGGIAASYCTKLLSDAGADVVTVEPPAGAPGRTRWPPGLFEYLHASKRSVGTAEGHRLAPRADIVVARPEFGLPSLPRHRPPQVTVTISPFGTTGPWAGRPATEFVLQAACGSTGSRGYPGGQPLAAGGALGEWLTGTYAAVGALAGWWRAVRSGSGCQLDISMLDCMAVGLVTYPSVFAEFATTCGREPMAAAIRKVEVPSIEPTADGWVTFTTNSAQQFSDFCTLIGHPELVGDPRYAQATARFVHRDRFEDMVRSYTQPRSSRTVLEEAALFRIPVAPVLEGAALLDFDQFRHRGVFVENPSGGFLQPRRPYRLHGWDLPSPGVVPGPAEHDGQVIWPLPRVGDREDDGSGRDDSLPLAGVRVADLTAWWAGPYASQILGFLGADVLKVESTRRPDLMRLASVKGPGEDRWWEWGPLAHAANTNKRGLTIDLMTPEGTELALRLAGSVDVLVENYTPRVLEQFGLSWERLHLVNDRLVLLRMPAFGLDGPWADRPGFAQTMESVSGLAAATGWSGGGPVLVGGAGDPLAALHASFSSLVALFARERRGRGYLVESTMVESVLACAAAAPIEVQLTGRVRGRVGNRSHTGSVPQGAYRCAGEDEWLAIEVEDDGQWEALCAVLGPAVTALRAPPIDLGGAPTRTREDRASVADEIDSWLAETLSGLDASDLAERLVSMGVPAAVVIPPARVADNPQLLHRGLFEQEVHPVTGCHRLPGLPMAMSGVTAWTRRPSPLLGQHNDEILEELGVSASGRAELRSRGVIGDLMVGG